MPTKLTSWRTTKNRGERRLKKTGKRNKACASMGFLIVTSTVILVTSPPYNFAGFQLLEEVGKYRISGIDDTTTVIDTTTNNDLPPWQNVPSAAGETPNSNDEKKEARTAPSPTLTKDDVPRLPSSFSSSEGQSVVGETPSTGSSSVPPLNLIPNEQLREKDFFSDSWIITREKFLDLERRRLGIVEDACFVAIGGGGESAIYPTSKMFVDWTDFMVEHMSKWWNELRILHDPDPAMFDLTLSHFGSYAQRVFEENTSQPETLQQTIAVVAFAPYRGGIANRGRSLTVYSLAATLASLYQVGFGRAVVAGYGKEDQAHVEATFKFLATRAASASVPPETSETSGTRMKIGNSEFGFAKVTEQDWISTKWVKFNMPRGAVIGLQEALKGNVDDGDGVSSDNATSTATAWLGSIRDASYWKYVYLTEPDTILHTKRSLLPSIKKGLDDGLSFFPHRLQPIPHQSDLPNGKDKGEPISPAHFGRFVPHHVHPFSNVTVLGPTEDGNSGVAAAPAAAHCCDSGRAPVHEGCGRWWWTCGFDDGSDQATLSAEEALDKHQRLAIYPMMRLKRGTGIVFGPTEHGKRCYPSNDPCPLMMSAD